MQTTMGMQPQGTFAKVCVFSLFLTLKKAKMTFYLCGVCYIKKYCCTYPTLHMQKSVEIYEKP